MKKLLCIFMLAAICLASASGLAAVDNSAFTAALESISITTKDPFGSGADISISFTDLAPNMFFQGFYSSITGEPSADSAWDMYISEAYPTIVRWVDDNGAAIQIDLSLEEPLTMISYAPADAASILTYDSKNSKVFEMTPFGQSEIALEDTEKWVTVSLMDNPDGTKGFCVMFMDTQALLASKAEKEKADAAPDESPYTPDQFVGNWHCPEIQRILQVSLNDVWLYTSNGGGTGSSTPFKLSGDEMIVRGLGTFRIEDVDGDLRLVCVESDHIAKDMVFVTGDEIISFEELTSQTWINQEAGEKLIFENGEYTYVHSSGSSHAGPNSMVYLVGKTLYVTGADAIFEIVQENGCVKLIGETGAFTSASDAPPVPECAIGEKIATDMVEFTLTGFDFVYHLDPASYMEKDDISGGSLGPGVDNVFANPEYQLRNISKTPIGATDAVSFTVDYNGGYLYSTNDNSVSYLYMSPYIAGKYNLNWELASLKEEKYEAYIPAVNLIDTDTASPLKLVVTLESSTGPQDFIYIIR